MGPCQQEARLLFPHQRVPREEGFHQCSRLLHQRWRPGAGKACRLEGTRHRVAHYGRWSGRERPRLAWGRCFKVNEAVRRAERRRAERTSNPGGRLLLCFVIRVRIGNKIMLPYCYRLQILSKKGPSPVLSFLGRASVRL